MSRPRAATTKSGFYSASSPVLLRPKEALWGEAPSLALATGPRAAVRGSGVREVRRCEGGASGLHWTERKGMSEVHVRLISINPLPTIWVLIYVKSSAIECDFISDRPAGC